MHLTLDCIHATTNRNDKNWCLHFIDPKYPNLYLSNELIPFCRLLQLTHSPTNHLRIASSYWQFLGASWTRPKSRKSQMLIIPKQLENHSLQKKKVIVCFVVGSVTCWYQVVNSLMSWGWHRCFPKAAECTMMLPPWRLPRGFCRPAWRTCAAPGSLGSDEGGTVH